MEKDNEQHNSPKPVETPQLGVSGVSKCFIWVNENCNISFVRNWYLYLNGICHVRIKEHLDGFLVFNETNLKGIYFDFLSDAKRWGEVNIC